MEEFGTQYINAGTEESGAPRNPAAALA